MTLPWVYNPHQGGWTHWIMTLLRSIALLRLFAPCSCCRNALSTYPSATNEVEDQENNRDDQQKVNQPARDVECSPTE
jgi:hypothetical protein